ncbi:hypothetical protein PYW07_002812 [Mythimna separata]|uniref:Uncharacterized protein n=1 Tax=Mythimna separata TaxID=271217 RepID=A0AAD7YGE2_MYTSE|nr:hypothetical protein PYW07_002812 [Mythimna separata]
MELMSSLLFCALVAHLPQAFGESSPDSDVKFNNSMVFRQMPMPKKILLNINGPPLVNMVSDLQTVFMDVACRQCIDCMERAIKAYTTHHNIVKTIPSTDELHDQVLRLRSRNRRDSQTDNTTTKTKKNKSKKKATKSVTVTKYNVDGNVFALKVKETNMVASGDRQNVTQVSTCQVFSVQNSFPCDSAEGESFLTNAKRKVSKKSKKVKDVNKDATTSKPHFNAPAFRKRQIDNSEIPDNFMPSIEDFY